jgi:hypothetical protein
MSGGIMPKFFALRWPIGVVGALLLIAGAAFFWGGSQNLRVTSPLAAISAFFAGGEDGGERRELRFLQAALQRIEAELQQQANGLATASLRIEREAVTQRVREVASLLPADSLPPEIRLLIEPEVTLTPVPAPAPRPAAIPVPAPAPESFPGLAARRGEEAEPTGKIGELRVGLRPPAAVADFSGLALQASSRLPAFAQRPPASRTAPATPTAPPTAAADRTGPRPSAR